MRENGKGGGGGERITEGGGEKINHIKIECKIGEMKEVQVER